MPQATFERVISLILGEEHLIPVNTDGTNHEIQFADITDKISEAVNDCGWKNGVLFIDVNSPDYVLIAQEAGQFVEQDIATRIEQFAPHKNGWQGFFPASLALPVHENLVLGRYQRIINFGSKLAEELPLSFYPSQEAPRTFSVNTGAGEHLFYEHRKGTIEEKTEERIFDITEMLMNTSFQTREGFAYIFVPHTTCALVAETPANMLSLNGKLDLLVPSDAIYVHDDFARRSDVPPNETKNGRAHVKAALLKPWLTIILQNNLPALEQGKRVYILDLDAPRQSRQVYITTCPFQ